MTRTSDIKVGTVFNTAFENNCRVTSEPDEIGNFMAFDSKGVECEFNVQMVTDVEVRYHVGQTVAFVGRTETPDEGDKPCQDGICLAEVVIPTIDAARFTRVRWTQSCPFHSNQRTLGNLVGMTETVKPDMIRPYSGE